MLLRLHTVPACRTIFDHPFPPGAFLARRLAAAIPPPRIFFAILKSSFLPARETPAHFGTSQVLLSS